MKRLILALSILATTALSFVMAHREAENVIVENLPACKTGWKLDAALRDRPINYIPIQFVLRVAESTNRGTIMRIVDAAGQTKATVRRGQEVSVDCFDILPGDTI